MTITTSVVFDALPEDGSHITYGELIRKLDVDQAEDGGMVRAVLLVLDDQGKAALDHGTGWYRLVEVTEPKPDLADRFVVIREDKAHGDEDWGVYDRERTMIAPFLRETSARAHYRALVDGDETIEQCWWREPGPDERARGEAGAPVISTVHTLVDDDGGRFVLVRGEYNGEEADDYSEEENENCYAILDRRTGWLAWYAGEGDSDYPLGGLRSLRRGEMDLLDFGWTMPDGETVPTADVKRAMEVYA